MRTTIDAAGRVVVPKAFRHRLGIAGPAEVEIEEQDGSVVIVPVRAEVRMEIAEDGFPVLVPPAGTPPLTDDELFRVLDEVREWPRHS